jgi:hypothetical protein
VSPWFLGKSGPIPSAASEACYTPGPIGWSSICSCFSGLFGLSRLSGLFGSLNLERDKPNKQNKPDKPLTDAERLTWWPA